MKLGRRHNYHKGQPALRIYANHLLNVLNVKELVGAFNQGEALVGAVLVIVKTDGSFAALVKTQDCAPTCGHPGGQNHELGERDAHKGTLAEEERSPHVQDTHNTRVDLFSFSKT